MTTNCKKCKHKNKKFIGIIDYRGFPEQLFLCKDCGTTISDYITDDDLSKIDTDSSFQTHHNESIFDRYNDPFQHINNEIL